ncbi:hypothetical protein ACFQFC_36555 [Amorphoplanes digitatis]|uniref:Integral membrane protein n=1 Tax=Actinoplanes digitatis TaxID=1868 RepID=A0A7W7HVQ5_9ACTN|nr:hypothetical protein [Actinoplanes digitatis]MBB4761672.1 hypothetical protein [Actinoplanes digitatis]GID90782.1 hypothetical protein Adi01nite_01940 [Actinoplanes digitatis]
MTNPPSGTWRAVGHVALHLVTPLLMCLGMGLAYLSAFDKPHPRHLNVAVVGADEPARALAARIRQRAGDAFDVRTVASRDAAADALRDRTLVGAFVPDPHRPELLVAKANSETSASVAESLFREVAAAQGGALAVTNLTPLAAGDPTGQGIFFFLVLLSIGSYASVAAIGAAGAGLAIWIRALLGLSTALVVSVVGIVLAGPVFHVVDHQYPLVWTMALLYSAGILAVGIGVHTFLKRWTTLAMMVVFVMLNFTSSGGVFRPELQNAFFARLHSFWDGAGFVEGVRSLLYFGRAAGFAGHLLTLTGWLAAGLALLAAAALTERRRARPAVDAGEDAAALEEIEETVAA